VTTEQLLSLESSTTDFTDVSHTASDVTGSTFDGINFLFYEPMCFVYFLV
jgi:hypothetical protein